jgi:hypothetical protein
MAYARGLLAEDAASCFDYLASNISEAVLGDRPTLKQRFVRGARAFAESPAPVALVTSSGRYEVDVVIPVVFEGLREEVATWPVGEATRTRVLEAFGDYEQFYAAIVTASDSHEIRLKPYRDLYSIALQQLGLDAAGAEQVVGFEDTEPGIVASRAAGVGMPCAVPFEGTLTHDFSAAAHVLHGGVTEALVGYALFLPDSLVAG